MKEFYKSSHILLEALIVVLVFQSCELAENNASVTNNFQKTYTWNDGDASVYAVDADEVTEGGFLILNALSDSQSNVFPRVQLIKTTPAGEPEWQVTTASNYYAPSAIFKIQNQHYVLCMGDNQLGVLLKVDINAHTLEEAAKLNIFMPLSAKADAKGTGAIISSYNRFGNVTDIIKINASLQETWRTTFPVGTDEELMEINILNHLQHKSRYRFFANEISIDNTEYFIVNGFANYTLALLYLNPDEGSLAYKINGYQFNGFVHSVVKTQAESAFLVYAQDGKVYMPEPFIPQTGGFININDLQGDYYPEIDGHRYAEAIVYDDKGIVLAANGNNGNPRIVVFDNEGSNVQKSIELPAYYPSEIVKAKKLDDGIILLQQTEYANYLKRVSLVKIPESFLFESN